MNEIDVIEILTKYPDCKTNGGKFRAILMDLYPNASKAIVNTLVLMSDCGIVEEIYSAKQIDSFHESRWKKKLEDDYGISDKIICECLSLITKSDAKQHPSNNDAGVNKTREQYLGSDYSVIKTINAGENDTTQYVFHYQLGYGKIISKDKLIKVVFDSCPYKTMLFRESEIGDGKNVYLVSQQEYYNNHDRDADCYSNKSAYTYDNPTPCSVRRKTDSHYISNRGYNDVDEFEDYDALIDSGDMGMDYEDYDEEY